MVGAGLGKEFSLSVPVFGEFYELVVQWLFGGHFSAEFADCGRPAEERYCGVFVEEGDFLGGVLEGDAEEDVLGGELLQGADGGANNTVLFTDRFDDWRSAFHGPMRQSNRPRRRRRSDGTARIWPGCRAATRPSEMHRREKPEGKAAGDVSCELDRANLTSCRARPVGLDPCELRIGPSSPRIPIPTSR